MYIVNGKRKRLANLWLKLFPIRSSDGVFVARGSVLTIPVRIGAGSRFNGATYMRGAGGVELGRYCAIGHLCRFVTSNHGMGYPNMQFQLARSLGLGPQREASNGIKVGHNVWIGDSVIILPGVTIGNGAVIGAGSIVTRDVERYAVYAGNPARKIRDRFDESVKNAMEIAKWWTWSPERMKRASRLFGADLSAMAPTAAIELIEQVTRDSLEYDA